MLINAKVFNDCYTLSVPPATDFQKYKYMELADNHTSVPDLKYVSAGGIYIHICTCIQCCHHGKSSAQMDVVPV